jgi:hypothetical protein
MGKSGAAALTVILALTLTACGGGIDTGKLEDEVSSDAQEQVDAAGLDATVTSVDCPDDIESETGEQFDCQVSLSDGTSATANGEVTDGDEGDVEYTFSEN